MKAIPSIAILAVVLYLLRDSGYWALVVIPYAMAHFMAGIAVGTIRAKMQVLRLVDKFVEEQEKEA